MKHIITLLSITLLAACGNLATKEDIAQVRADINALQASQATEEFIIGPFTVQHHFNDKQAKEYCERLNKEYLGYDKFPATNEATRDWMFIRCKK